MNPIIEKTAAKKKKQPLALTENDLLRLENTILNDKLKIFRRLENFYKCRNALMFKLQFYTGCRPKEMYNLRQLDIDFKNKKIYIRGESNKLRKDDFVFLPWFLESPLRRYLFYKEAYFPDNEWLWPSKRKGVEGRLDRSSYNRIFRYAIRKAGLYHVNYIDGKGKNRANYKPYSLRFGFANWVWPRINYDLKKLQVLMRHKSINSTLCYIQVSDTELRERIIQDVFGKPPKQGWNKKAEEKLLKEMNQELKEKNDDINKVLEIKMAEKEGLEIEGRK